MNAKQILNLWYRFVAEMTKGKPQNLNANIIWKWPAYLREHGRL